MVEALTGNAWLSVSTPTRPNRNFEVLLKQVLMQRPMSPLRDQYMTQLRFFQGIEHCNANGALLEQKEKNAQAGNRTRVSAYRAAAL